MSDVIYSAKFFPLSDVNKKEEYFAIPVSIIKVMLTISEKPNLNHFERAILSLLLGRYHSAKELADRLLLKTELVDLILNDLRTKGFVTKDNKVTQNGENVLKGFYSDKKQENCYLFFDWNRRCLLNAHCTDNDIVITKSKIYENSYGFSFENDAFKENVAYRYIKLENKTDLTPASIEKIVRNNVFIDKSIENLVNVEIIEFSKKIYHLVTSIETHLDHLGTKYIVKNPITLENDEGLSLFIYDNCTHPQIKLLLTDLMNFRLNQQSHPEEARMFEEIKNKLFTSKVKDEHADLIIPLMNVIKALDNHNNSNLEDRVYRNGILKSAMVNLGDLYEKILYEYALRNPYRDNTTCIGKVIDDNKVALCDIAKSCGFDVGSNGEKLFLVNKQSLQRVRKNPNNAQLQECISWNLAIATNDKNHFFYRLAQKYPSFINLMYQFKREYRDNSKHSTQVTEISPKSFIKLMFDMLELAFGYKVNNQELMKLIDLNDNIYDYSCSETSIRTRIGNRIFELNSEKLTEIRFNLLSMYDDYLIEDCRYITYAYSLLDTYIRFIAESIKGKYKCNYLDFDKEFHSINEVEKYLVSLGFKMGFNEEVGNNVIDSLEYMGSEKNIERCFVDGFKNANLRFKLLALIDMFKQNIHIPKEFLDFNLDDLFLITSTLSYLQGHQQIHEFNNKYASIIVRNVMKITDFIVNKSNLIKW